MERVELLMREYEANEAHLLHWDSHFWQQSQFFVAIESILLAVIVQRLSSEFGDNTPMNFGIFLLIVAVVLFNLFICYSWFRTNRSTRDYMNAGFIRALQIENEPELKGIVQMYRVQQTTLAEPKYAKHSSSPWEVHLPFAFMAAWLGILVAGSLDSITMTPAIVAGSTITLALGLILLIEKTGWPRPMRETVTLSPREQGKHETEDKG